MSVDMNIVFNNKKGENENGENVLGKFGFSPLQQRQEQQQPAVEPPQAEPQPPGEKVEPPTEEMEVDPVTGQPIPKKPKLEDAIKE